MAKRRPRARLEPAAPPARYGVDAEIERMLRCPNCGSASVRATRQSMSSYGFFGFKAIGDLSSAREVVCRNCATEWVRPPLREIRREAERRINERYDLVEVENQRLRDELAGLTRPEFPEASVPEDGEAAN
jgi:hypothetical protein